MYFQFSCRHLGLSLPVTFDSIDSIDDLSSGSSDLDNIRVAIGLHRDSFKLLAKFPALT